MSDAFAKAAGSDGVRVIGPRKFKNVPQPTDRQKEKNRAKSSVRAAVEHPFLTIKQLFKFTKVSYKGLAKNAHRFFVACGLANLHRARHFLMRADRRGAPAAG